jgi:hypothetical protein
MRHPSVRPLARLAAFLLPTAAAMLLAACGNPVGPRETEARQRPEKATLAERVTTLGDSDQVGNDSTNRGGFPPWW